MLLSELADRLDGEILGQGDTLEVTGVSTIRDAAPSEVCYYGNPRYRSDLLHTGAGAVLVSEEIETSALNTIIVKNPYRAFREVLLIFEEDEKTGFAGVHPTAVVHPEAILHETVLAGPNAVVEKGTVVAAGSKIGAGCFIGPSCIIGRDCTIHPGVSIYRRCVLGERVTLHSGAVIGSDGFGFVPDPEGHLKVPQNGYVEIGNDVEIGACTTVDRAVVGCTRIGAHTKLDNLIQIAHNVTIGPGCLIAAQTGIAGSTKLGAGVVCGGQVGISGHLSIGDRVVIAAQSGVMKDIPAGLTVSGYPARPHDKALRIGAAIADLPELRYRMLRFMQDNDIRTEEDSR